MLRSPSLPLSDDDAFPSVQPVVLFPQESQEIRSSDPDIESGESTASESGWSDTDSDLTPIRDPVSSVALDMDEVVVEVEEQEEPSDDDEDSEESGGLAED
jgi:hypothetical protein